MKLKDLQLITVPASGKAGFTDSPAVLRPAQNKLRQFGFELAEFSRNRDGYAASFSQLSISFSA
jgi:hypothetical protein